MKELTKTVLIVDDEIIIRQSFMDYFEDRLWRVLEADSGEQALEIMEKESPQAAIVDIRLGGMDGNAFIRDAYRKKPKTAFVICTGSPEYDLPADLQKLPGVSGHVFRKPVTDMAKLEGDLLRLLINSEKRRD